MLIQINKNTRDPFYRYKMETVQISVKNKKTKIKNIESIAKSLFRPPELLIKFIAIHAGCSFSSSTLNGEFDNHRLQDLVYSFIEDYVLCKICKNPETKFIESKSLLQLNCSSCGAVCTVTDNKFTPHILKYLSSSTQTFTDTNYFNKPKWISYFKENSGDKEAIYDYFKSNDVSISDIFCGLVKPSEFMSFELIVKNTELSAILANIENMLEKHEKSQYFYKYLEKLLEMKIPAETISNYYYCANNQISKTRNPLIRRQYKEFIEEHIE